MASFPTCAELKTGDIEVFSDNIVIPEDGTYWGFADVSPWPNFEHAEAVCYITDTLEIVHQDILSFSSSSMYGEASDAFDVDSDNGTITIAHSMQCRVRFSLAVEAGLGDNQGGFAYIDLNGDIMPGSQIFFLDDVSGWDSVYGEGRFSVGENDVLSLKVDPYITGGGAPDIYTWHTENMSWFSVECLVDSGNESPSIALVVGDEVSGDSPSYRVIASGSGGIGGVFSATEGQMVGAIGDGVANSIHIFKIDGLNEWGVCSNGQIG